MTHTPEQIATRSFMATMLLDTLGAGPRVEGENKLSYEARSTAGEVFVNWCKSAQRRFEAEHPRTDAERKVFLQEMISAATNFATGLVAFSAYGFLEQPDARKELRDKILGVIVKKLDDVENAVSKIESELGKLGPEEMKALSGLFVGGQPKKDMSDA